MITPACNSDAGAATVLLADVGNIRVTNTPIPNAASRISIRSGLLSTVLLSLHVQRGALFCTFAQFLSLSGSNHYLVIISQTWTKSIPQTGQRKPLKTAPFLAPGESVRPLPQVELVGQVVRLLPVRIVQLVEDLLKLATFLALQLHPDQDPAVGSPVVAIMEH